jgi:hypothetical protein
MAATAFLAPCDSSTLANFLLWAQTTSNAMVTAGLVRTADTGQYGGVANWAAVTLPVAGGSIYEILRFNDTAQATNPVYVRMVYGRGAANQARIAVSIGTGTDGAGNLTDNVSGVSETSGNLPTASTTLYACYVAGAAGWLTVLLWRDYTSSKSPYTFAIERSLNTSGAYTDQFTYICGAQQDNTAAVAISQVVMKPGGAFPTTTRERYIPICVPNGNVSGIYNGVIHVSHIFPLMGAVANRQTVIGAMKLPDAAEGASYTCTVYGTTRTYLSSKYAVGFYADGYTCSLVRQI